VPAAEQSWLALPGLITLATFIFISLKLKPVAFPLPKLSQFPLVFIFLQRYAAVQLLL